MTHKSSNKQIMAKNIQSQLDKRGLNAKEFALQLNFKYTTVLDWLHAKTYPRIDKIEKMANYFGIDKAMLVEDTSTYNVSPAPNNSHPDIDDTLYYNGKEIPEKYKKIIKDLMDMDD